MRILKKEIWPEMVVIPITTKKDADKIEEWLGERLGCLKDQWNVVYQYSHCDYYFKNGEDATMFALRWK